MGLMHILWSLLVGFIVGFVARALLPGADHIGFLATSLVGIAGSFVGGFIGNAVWTPSEGAKSHPAGFVMSVVGAVVVLLVIRHL